MERGQPLGDGFQLLIGLAEIHVPRMWVERHVSKPDSQVSATRSEYKVRLCENQNFLLYFLVTLQNLDHYNRPCLGKVPFSLTFLSRKRNSLSLSRQNEQPVNYRLFSGFKFICLLWLVENGKFSTAK